MTIGAAIRQLRQEHDISQLPALANFFDVTTDFLLGVDIRRKEDEVRQIIGEALKYEQRGGEGSNADSLHLPKNDV